MIRLVFEKMAIYFHGEGTAAKKKLPFIMSALMTREIMCSRDAQCNTGEWTTVLDTCEGNGLSKSSTKENYGSVYIQTSTGSDISPTVPPCLALKLHAKALKLYHLPCSSLGKWHFFGNVKLTICLGTGGRQPLSHRHVPPNSSGRSSGSK